MKRSALLCGLVLGACATSADVVVSAQTPASIEIIAWCAFGGDCRQKTADLADAHCRGGGNNAQFVRDELLQRDAVRGSRVRFNYDCVPLPGR